MDEGVTVRKKAELFSIRLDVGNGRDRKCEELSVPFNLPSGLLPTLIEKDRSAKVCYHIQVKMNTEIILRTLIRKSSVGN